MKIYYRRLSNISAQCYDGLRRKFGSTYLYRAKLLVLIKSIFPVEAKVEILTSNAIAKAGQHLNYPSLVIKKCSSNSEFEIIKYDFHQFCFLTKNRKYRGTNKTFALQNIKIKLLAPAIYKFLHDHGHAYPPFLLPGILSPQLLTHP